MRSCCLLVLLALAAPAATARAQWSAPATVSAPHTFVGPLTLQPGPFAGYPWQDGASDDRRLGASAAGPAGERPAPAGLVGIGRYGATRTIALAQTDIGRGASRRLRVAFGSVTGGFGAARTIATGAIAGRAQLSVAPDGRALAAWIQTRGSTSQVRVAYRPAGGRFGRAATILGTGRPSVVAIGIGAGNDFAMLAVRDGRVVARLRPRLGRWGPLQTLARPDGQTLWDLRVAVDGTGHVQAAWRRRQKRHPDAPPRRALEASSAVRGHGFGGVQTLASDGAGLPVLASTAAGWVLAHPAAAGAGNVARVHVRRNGERFGPRIDASPPTGGLRDVAVAVDAATGTMAAAWVVPTPAGNGGGRGEAAARPLGGPFGAPEAVTPDEAVSEIELTPAAGGGFVAAWVARPQGTGPGIPLSQLRTVVRESTRAAP
jgi:hypothetical protein